MTADTETWWDTFRHGLRRFFASTRVEAVIFVLILISVVLILVEPHVSGSRRDAIHRINVAFLLVFAVELALRFVAESTEEHFVRSYFKRWWLDVLAVYPPLLLLTFDDLIVLPALRALRFLRVLRLGRLFSSARYFFPYVAKRGAVHFGVVTAGLLLTVVVGTSVILALEADATDGPINGFEDAFWFNLYSLFAGEPIPAEPATLGGRIASVFVLGAGLVLFALFVGTVSAFMVERSQKEDLVHGIETMEDHMIVCGLGRSGYRILEVLKRLDQKVVVVERDRDSEFVDQAQRLKVPVLIADLRQGDPLLEAGVERARAVIACTNDDLTNLEVALDARNANPDIRVVLRMFDERLAEKVSEGFNIQVAFSTSALAAPAFAAAAVDRSVLGSLEVEGRVFIHSEFTVPESPGMAAATVADLRSEYGVHTLGFHIDDGGLVWSPGDDVAIPGGAAIIVVGPFEEVARLKTDLGVAKGLARAAPDERRGAGHIG